MQRVFAANDGRIGGIGGAPLAKVVLADGDAPRLVANVDKDVAATVEGAKGDAGVLWVAEGVHLEGLLDDEDGLLEGFPWEVVAVGAISRVAPVALAWRLPYVGSGVGGWSDRMGPGATLAAFAIALVNG